MMSHMWKEVSVGIADAEADVHFLMLSRPSSLTTLLLGKSSLEQWYSLVVVGKLCFSGT